MVRPSWTLSRIMRKDLTLGDLASHPKLFPWLSYMPELVVTKAKFFEPMTSGL